MSLRILARGTELQDSLPRPLRFRRTKAMQLNLPPVARKPLNDKARGASKYIS